MAYHRVQCDDGCNDGYLQCEHGVKKQHTVTEQQDRNGGRDVGRICQPPQCPNCVGTGKIMKWFGK